QVVLGECQGALQPGAEPIQIVASSGVEFVALWSLGSGGCPGMQDCRPNDIAAVARRGSPTEQDGPPSRVEVPWHRRRSFLSRPRETVRSRLNRARSFGRAGKPGGIEQLLRI